MVNVRYNWRLMSIVAVLLVGIAMLGRQVAGSGEKPRVLGGHGSTVSAVAFSPDGKWIASASMDHSVRLWETASGHPGLVLQGHTDEVYSIAFAPDGRQLASTGYDRKVIVWEIATGKPLRTMQGFADWAVTLAYAPNGQQLAVGGMDGSVTMFDPATGKVSRTLKPQEGITGLAFSADGKMLATSLVPIVLTDLATGQNTKTLQGPENIVSAVSFSPDGRLVAATSWDKLARIWNVATGSVVQTITPAADLPAGVTADSFPPEKKIAVEQMLTLPLTGVAFSPDGKLLATAGADKTVRLWEVATGKEVQRFHGHAKAVTCVAFSPDGTQVVSGSADKTLRIWAVSRQGTSSNAP